MRTTPVPASRAGHSRRGLLVLAVAAMAALALAVTQIPAPGGRASLDRTSAAARLLEEGKIAQAKALLLEEFKRDGRNPRVVRGLAIAEREAGNDEASLVHWQRLCALTSGEEAGFAWKQLGLAQHRLHEDLDALTSLETAATLLKDDDELARLIADLVTNAQTANLNRDPRPEAGTGARSGISTPPVRGPQPPDPTKWLPRRTP